MKMLYQYSITGDMKCPDSEEADLYEIGEIGEEAEVFIHRVEGGFAVKREEIDDIISENSHSWKIDRISKVDLAILRLALFEIREIGTPEKVAVNEAVELAKKYSAEKSYKYVNGLLGGYLKKQND